MPSPDRGRLPRWLKRQVPKGPAGESTRRLLERLRLQTVCENAKCPNCMECYSQKTATFLILGNLCTRGCGFCAVPRGRPEPPDPDEPRRVAEAAGELGLRHVVITSVTRDDLPDGGAEHYRRTIEAVRERTGAAIEVLTPDFIHNPDAVDCVLRAAPDVFNHNVETVPRLYPAVRDRRSDYAWTLELFRHVASRAPVAKIKTGMMLGLGETTDEVLDVLADLLRAGCRYLTLGQYLQPAPDRLPVYEYIEPQQFDRLGEAARAMGFEQVAAGPFVRSSYHAREMASTD